MIRRILATCAPLLTLTACANFVADVPGSQRDPVPGSPTQILVTIPQASAPAAGLAGAPGRSYLLRSNYGPAPSVDRSLDRIARDYGLDRVRGWAIDSLGVYCEVFELPSDGDSGELVTRLLQDPRVDLAQPMNFFETEGRSYDDPFLDLQTSVTSLAIDSAHELATGRGVTVAIVDSRIDADHPDLKSRVRKMQDLVDRTGRKSPEVHGTAIAGIIASAANNHEGIVGIAPDADLVGLRACWATRAGGSDARCSTFSLAQALELALRLEAQIINLSLAGPHDRLIASMIDEAIARGVIVIAAQTGRDESDLGFPASHPGVIAVTAPRSDATAGDDPVVHAPGREILSTAPHASYAFFSGNSLAAAHVSGVAALLLERAPEIGAEAIAQLLRETSTAAAAGWSINACRALARLSRAAVCDAEALALATWEE